MKWIIRFLLGQRELAEKMVEFLRARLDPAFTFRQKAGEVIIENVDTRDRAWRTAVWVKNQSGLTPRFVIEGSNEQGTTYLSTCIKCRSGESHYEHSGASRKGEDEAQASPSPEAT